MVLVQFPRSVAHRLINRYRSAGMVLAQQCRGTLMAFGVRHPKGNPCVPVLRLEPPEAIATRDFNGVVFIAVSKLIVEGSFPGTTSAV